MNGRELLERGLKLGIPLRRIEEELDWQENQGFRMARMWCTDRSSLLPRTRESLRGHISASERLTQAGAVNVKTAHLNN
jgi:hypothetical protein